MLRDDELLAEVTEPAPASAAGSVLPAIDRALARAGLEIEAIAAFAVTIGPGSFTGLRVGLATVKGLAFDPVRPVAAVPTLAALAAGAPADAGTVAALLDARRGEVYAAGYAGDPLEREPVIPEGLYRPEPLVERLPAPCVVVGDGIDVARAALEARGEALRILASLRAPRAADVARLGARLLARGEGRDPAELFPRYLRRPAAEAQREARSRSDAGSGSPL